MKKLSPLYNKLHIKMIFILMNDLVSLLNDKSNKIKNGRQRSRRCLAVGLTSQVWLRFEATIRLIARVSHYNVVLDL